jgi:predicted nucleotidyltransferase
MSGMAERLLEVDGVVGVMLGGSRARGTHAPDSDVDIGVYYRPPLDVADLNRLARELAGPDAEVTEVGAWGRWVDGGGWLTIDGTPVDWIYRDIERVRSSCRDATDGHVEFHFQVGHPFGVPSFGYAGELALGRILAEHDRVLSTLRLSVETFPGRLGEALVGRLWEARFAVDIARKAVGRADTTYVAACLSRSLLVCAYALLGRAGSWVVNEKGAVALAARTPHAPTGFDLRCAQVVGALGATPEALLAAVQAAEDLIEETAAACAVS